ncbi:MAG: glycosyltransferase [Acetatifactor sp.]|nr:glycosyltransferase [Acetatifactor sp.]
MPVFNAEKYVGIALDSLLEQSFKDMEIICVDDGSTDQSLKILQQYQKKDVRITILQQENKFAGVARNLGMSVARGKYLSFLDADDYFRPDMLQRAYECAEEENADIVVFGGEMFSEDINNVDPYPALLRGELLPPAIKNSFENKIKIENIMNFTIPVPWNKLFRREFILNQQLQFQNYKRANDSYFVLMALVLAQKIGIVHEKLICYRTGNANSLQGSRNEAPMQFADVYSDIQNKLMELNLYEQVEKSFRKRCLSTCVYMLEALTNADAFEKLYLKLQSELFARFNIIGSPMSDYYDRYAYNQYLYICSHTPMEYLMDKLKNKNKQKMEELNETIKKDNKILNLYERWLRLKDNNSGIYTFFQDNDFEKVAVYGMGSLGRSLCSELRSHNIDITYVIEQNSDRKNKDFTFYSIQDELPEADVIIITPITFYEEIAEQLAKKVKCPLLSFDDIVP